MCRGGAQKENECKEIKYIEYTALMRNMLKDLVNIEAKQRLGENIAMCFTPHSYRACLPSALKALGFTKGDLGWLSAWSAKGSEGYIRTSRSNTAKMQEKLAETLRDTFGKEDTIGEHDVLDQMRKRLSTRETNDTEISELIARVESFKRAVNR